MLLTCALSSAARDEGVKGKAILSIILYMLYYILYWLLNPLDGLIPELKDRRAVKHI